MFREMRRKRQLLPTERTEEILRTGNTGVLGVEGDDGYPYTVPVNYVYEEGTVYFHCAKSGHKLDAIRRNDKVSFCVIDQETIVPKEFTTYFRSAVVFGRASEVEDEAEKRRILRLLNTKYAPGLETAGDQEIEKEWKAVCIVKVEVEHMTGKEAIELVRAAERDNGL